MPYVVARPVSDTDFYGREQLLESIYSGTEWATWLIGGRRMGKTSVLHQLRYLSLNDPRTVALYCNWQPAEDLNSVKEVLLRSITDEIAATKLNSEMSTLKSGSFFDVIDYLDHYASPRNLRIFLLIDEPEDFLRSMAQHNQPVLKQMRTLFLRGGAIRTVISSGPGLRTLYDSAWHTSPFWEGFDPQYIGPIDWQSAWDLVHQTKSGRPQKLNIEVASTIVNRAGSIPWLIQNVCRVLEPLNEQTTIDDRIWDTHQHDDRFATDYRMLSELERLVLRTIGISSGEQSLEEISTRSGAEVGLVSESLFRLGQLGYIIETPDAKFSVSNVFLTHWLTKGLWEPTEARLPPPVITNFHDVNGVHRQLRAEREPAYIERKPIRNRWALLVGVNHYADPAYNDLNYCVDDVIALEALLNDADFRVVTLHDRVSQDRLLPTLENIEAELIRLCQVADKDDLIYLHFSGHGTLLDGQPILLTRDVRDATLQQRGLRLSAIEDAIRDSKANRRVITLDACHVGAETGRSTLDSDFLKNVHDLAEGFALIAASTARQVAHESLDKQHGVFSYYLLDGLRGAADKVEKQFVTVDDIKNHLLDNLRRWSIQHGGLIQEPTVRCDGLGDIIIVDYR